jgi:hypothetical protein
LPLRISADLNRKDSSWERVIFAVVKACSFRCEDQKSRGVRASLNSWFIKEFRQENYRLLLLFRTLGKNNLILAHWSRDLNGYAIILQEDGKMMKVLKRSFDGFGRGIGRLQKFMDSEQQIKGN